MNTTLVSVIGLLALLSPCITHAAPQTAATTPRILITLQVLDVPLSATQNLVLAPYPAAGVFEKLMKAGSEATEISVQTPADFPGVARYSRAVAFDTGAPGKIQHNFVTYPTSLEATPHINADGTIKVSLQMDVTSVLPLPKDAKAGVAGFPSTKIESLTALRTFKSGVPQVLSGLILNAQDSKTPVTTTEQETLILLTVTVLPDKVALRQTLSR